ncbi:Protein WVD2-like 4 [Zea mays]|uniref:Protein WVD2-like 4 n=1 Tax=Zea mays TaxID=4577 RepID=A0A3L6FBA2_MAIZE|nr:Protein WVD2-like 4 [Zea mays]
MEDAGREGGAAAENGTEGEGYVLVKAVPEGEGDPAAAAAGGDREDLAASAPAMAVAVAAADEAAAPAKKGGSGATKARPQNGRVPAGTSAAAAPRVKKPGVLSQSASFPARGAVAVAAKKAAAAVATPKQAKGAVPIGSETAAALAGRAVEKKASSARTPVARRPMVKLVKSGSVDAAAPNDTVVAVQESDENTDKPLKQTQPGKTEDDVHSTTSSTNTPRAAARKSAAAAAAGFSFRLEERAEKRKEESQEAEIKLLRKSLTFKATPMPSFYKEQPPKVELKKIPPTRARSPRLGRHKAASSATAPAPADGFVSCGSPRSTANSGKVNEIMENIKPRVPARKSIQRPVTKTPLQVSATTKAEPRPIATKPKIANSKPKVSRAKVAQAQGNSAEVPPSEPSASEELVVEHGVGEATGPDLAPQLVASNEVPVHG